MVIFGQCNEAVDGIAVTEDAATVVFEFVLDALVIALLNDRTKAFSDFFERARDNVIAKVGLVNAQNGVLSEEGIAEVTEEFGGGDDGVFYCIMVPFLSVFAQDTAISARVINTFERAIDRV